MRWSLLAVRLSIIAVNLAIATIIILSVLPLVTGGLRVDVPQSTDPRPAYQDGNITISVPLDIYNGGYFDIKDFKVRFLVNDGTDQVADYTSRPVDIVTGRTNRVNVDLRVDLTSIPAEELRKLVFNQTILGLDMRIEAGYALGLVKASMRMEQTMNWDPLISGFSVNTGGAQTVTNGSNLDLLVPYSFQASDMIQGSTVDVQATLRNSSALLGSTGETITVQQYNQGQLRFVLSPQEAQWLASHPEDLVIGTDLGFQGASVHNDYQYHWGGMQ